jgi:uncharacterized metal-binding protein
LNITYFGGKNTLLRNYMDCLSCTQKNCKVKGVDCFGVHDVSVNEYAQKDALSIAMSASELIDNGRAGKLSRIQEAVEFCRLQKYNRVGLAYCFGIEKIAEKVGTILVDAGIKIIAARCTIGGVKECEIDALKNTQAISCNPVGQAELLNSKADFVMEMGLCLGHDVLFHKKLTVPFTVLLVKDRVYGHNPLAGIDAYRDMSSIQL